MKTKTVKEKLEKLVNKHLILEKLTIVDEHIEQDWEGEIIVRKDILLEKIDKLYRKEMNKVRAKTIAEFVHGDIKAPQLEKYIKYIISSKSYTCCNIEVSKPKGTEVMCPECKEYCQTK